MYTGLPIIRKIHKIYCLGAEIHVLDATRRTTPIHREFIRTYYTPRADLHVLDADMCKIPNY